MNAYPPPAGNQHYFTSMLIIGIVGGAVLPQIYAYLAEFIDFQDAFLFVMAPGYAYILFYGIFGHRAGQAQRGRVAQQKPEQG